MWVVVDGMRERIGCDTRASRQRTGFDTVVVERRVPLVVLLVRALFRLHKETTPSTSRSTGRASRRTQCQTESRGEGGQGGGGERGGKSACAEGGPEGKRRSIMRPSRPNATLARARALFVFVVHTMNTMSGAMQFSRW